jgi:hypothetical protein
MMHRSTHIRLEAGFLVCEGLERGCWPGIEGKRLHAGMAEGAIPIPWKGKNRWAKSSGLQNHIANKRPALVVGAPHPSSALVQVSTSKVDAAARQDGGGQHNAELTK